MINDTIDAKFLSPQLGRAAEILLVDDDEDDVFLTREAFRKSHLIVNLNRVKNGLECMRFLRKEGEFREASRPDLVLLDLHMPVMDGREVLREMTADGELRDLPVVVLSTASEFEDIRSLYQANVNSYIRKPIDFEGFLKAVQGIGEYWFVVVRLPLQ